MDFFLNSLLIEISFITPGEPDRGVKRKTGISTTDNYIQRQVFLREILY